MKKVTINKLASPNHRLLKPLVLTIGRESNGYYTVGEGVFGRYGIGKTVDEAILCYEDCLLNYWEVLEELAEELSPEQRHQLDQIRQLAESGLSTW